MGKAIGIDLGTTSSCVAVMRDNGATVIENREGARTTPSIVAISGRGQPLIGEGAKRQAVNNPQNTVSAFKRLLGRRYDEVVTKDGQHPFPYHIVKARNGDAWIEVGRKEYSPSQISAFLLQELKEAAEAFLGESVTEAVIAVPAYFNESQRQATKDAGTIAGLDVLKTINESTAAALAYGHHGQQSGTIAVYDLGGGFFDISLLELGDGVFEVKATGGDAFLGGEDFDARLVDYVAYEFNRQYAIDLRDDKMALQRLKEAAESTKVELSTSNRTLISVPFIATDRTGSKDLNMHLTRTSFEFLIGDLIEPTLKPCRIALSDGGLTASDIDEVILVGNMTRMPSVVEAVKSVFGDRPHYRVYSDDLVAEGAAIEAGLLKGNVKDVLLLDVTPFSLGIETDNVLFTRMIDRNTTIPTRKSRMFTTTESNQSSMRIQVFQGEREMARDNKFLGQFDLVGISEEPQGVPKIEVTFDIESSGILNVSARDKATETEQAIRVKAPGGLSGEELETMVREAEQHVSRDRERRALIDARAKAQRLIIDANKLMSEHSDAVSVDRMAAVVSAIWALKTIIDGEQGEAIGKETETLAEAVDKLRELRSTD